MSKSVPSSYLWTPRQGPDIAALERMRKAFPIPAKPMGEAWFLAEEREMYPQLFGELKGLSDDDVAGVIEQIARGASCFGPLEEWIEWYRYLLPQLIVREWEQHLYQRAELLITAFMAQHPMACGILPYPEYQRDALNTLGRYIMSPHFWPDGEFDAINCLCKWTGPSGIAGWYHAGGLLSASLFFSIKYLSHADVEPWFRSVIGISDRYWKVQLLTWLAGAHPILTGQVEQPSELPEHGPFGIEWEWSHSLDGHYSGHYAPPIQRIPFLPAANCDAVVQIARDMKVEAFLEQFFTDPEMSAVASEVAGLPERFVELYRTDR
jgi:hypothetical protein